MKKVISDDVFGFVKPLVDVHTMGIYTIVNLLRDCGYTVHMAGDDINEALENICKVNNYNVRPFTGCLGCPGWCIGNYYRYRFIFGNNNILIIHNVIRDEITVPRCIEGIEIIYRFF